MNGDEKERQFHTNSDLAWYLLPEIELHTESYRQCLYKDFVYLCENQINEKYQATYPARKSFTSLL